MIRIDKWEDCVNTNRQEDIVALSAFDVFFEWADTSYSTVLCVCFFMKWQQTLVVPFALGLFNVLSFLYPILALKEIVLPVLRCGVVCAELSSMRFRSLHTEGLYSAGALHMVAFDG